MRKNEMRYLEYPSEGVERVSDSVANVIPAKEGAMGIQATKQPLPPIVKKGNNER